MTDKKKKPATQRSPRKSARATPRKRTADAAKSGPEPTAGDAPAIPSPQSAHAGHAAGAGQKPASSHVLATIPLHVRWRDLDAFNHVNNSSYLTFLEEARLQWLRTVPGEWFNAHAMPVMAAVELHYRKPITWPAEVDILLSCERLGNSSMTIGNRIVDRHDADCVYADGNIVMVWIDPATGASVALPEAIRNACAT